MIPSDKNDSNPEWHTNSTTTTTSSKRERAATLGQWKRIGFILFVFVSMVVVAVGVYFAMCGGNGCKNSSSSSSTSAIGNPSTGSNPPIQNASAPQVSSLAPSTVLPRAPIPSVMTTTGSKPPIQNSTAAPMSSFAPNAQPSEMGTATIQLTSLLPTLQALGNRAEQVVSFINNITLSGRTISGPNGTYDTESVHSHNSDDNSTAAWGTDELEQALAWIINDDPLQLLPDTPTHQFQLMQRYALSTIIVQQSEPNPWNNKTAWAMSECKWFGITCETIWLGSDLGTQRAVTEIRIDPVVVTLKGVLPVDFGLLSSLVHLDMYDSDLQGSLPASISLWENITYVNFCDNEFSGSLPTAIGTWQNVEELCLSYNLLTGSLPWSIGNMKSIKTLYFCCNQLTGSLPTSIGNWSGITTLSFANNKLSGSLPTSIGKWQSITEIYLDSNLLTGSLPTSIGNWSSIEEVHLGSNRLNGTLPSSIGNWQFINHFDLSYNQFTGTFPDSIGANWTDLRVVSVDNNIFTGEVPKNWCLPSRYLLLYVDCLSEVTCSCCNDCY